MHLIMCIGVRWLDFRSFKGFPLTIPTAHMVNYNVIFVFFIFHDFEYDYAVISYALAVKSES